MAVAVARVKSVPRHLRAVALGLLPVPNVDEQPASPVAWIDLANRRLNDLDPSTRELIENHDLRPSSYRLRMFLPDISKGAGASLAQLYQTGEGPTNIAAAIGEIIRWKTIAQCAYSHRAGSYFDDAEMTMSKQWNSVIWPIIRSENFTDTLDLACGHGRNSELLRRHARSLDLIDINPSCIAACRARFGDQKDGCSFRYHLTDGNSLAGIADDSMSFVYSWDSMVHFDKLVVRNYVSEIARILRHAGSAFLHHSNYGAFAPNSDWSNNHGSRSDMTAELMQAYVHDAGLKVKFQRLSGLADGWGMDDLDCLTLLAKT